MADVRFLKSEVVITQPRIELSYRNLVLRYIWALLNECCHQNRSRVWISNSMTAIFNLSISIWRHNLSVSGSVWMKFGRQMLNHVEKQQILL